MTCISTKVVRLHTIFFGEIIMVELMGFNVNIFGAITVCGAIVGLGLFLWVSVKMYSHKDVRDEYLEEDKDVVLCEGHK
jgi:hypothetical protein